MVLTHTRPITNLERRELYKLQPTRFLLLVVLAILLAVLGAAAMYSDSWWLRAAGLVLEGMMFAHFVELQHQCLHSTATGHRIVDQTIGICLGLPMLVSFSDYQRHHLEHHRKLGTAANREFFAYEYDTLGSWSGLAKHFFMIPHYSSVFRNVYSLLFDRKRFRTLPGRVRFEYSLIAAWILGNTSFILAGHPSVLRVSVLPLLIAIPLHALIELPEHWGCTQIGSTQETTRTIRAGKLGVWLTNGNNYHVEHHLYAGIPNHNLGALHQLIKDNESFLSGSYRSFYRGVAKELLNRTPHGVNRPALLVRDKRSTQERHM